MGDTGVTCAAAAAVHDAFKWIVDGQICPSNYLWRRGAGDTCHHDDDSFIFVSVGGLLLPGTAGVHRMVRVGFGGE